MTPEVVLERFAGMIGPSLVDLMGRARSGTIAQRRREAMWLLRELCGLTHAQIGYRLGARSDATVAECLRTIDQQAAMSPDIHRHLQVLRLEVMWQRPPSVPARSGMTPDLCLLAVRSVLLNQDLSHEEARIAARQLIKVVHG